MQLKPLIRVMGCGAVVLALAGLTWLAVRQQRTMAQLRLERQQVQAELETLRTQAQSQNQSPEASPSPDQQAELDQLRENTRDLLRLRNEVRQLRGEQEEAERLRAANSQLLAALQGFQLSSNQIALITSVRQKGAALGVVPRPGDAPGGGPGVFVAGIDPNSPVAQSDLRIGDVIIRVDGRPTETLAQLQIEMLTKQPGETVAVDVIRTNSTLRIPIKTRALP